MDEEITQDDFLAAFGITNGAQSNEETNDGNQTNSQEPESNNGNPTSDDTTPTNNDDTTSDGDDTTQNGDNNDEGNGANQNQNQNATNKASQAFAAMRVELSQKNKLLEGVASVLGLDPKSKDSMNQIQSKLNEALAKKQGIPVETLERLNRLEQMEEQRNIEQIRNNAFLGFQKVKTTFNLNDDELQSFANDLVAEGKNPFTTNVDLMTEYKLKNFDKLLEQAKNQGVQSEIERASRAQNNASIPNQSNGGTGDQTPDKITSVKELTKWFNNQQKS